MQTQSVQCMKMVRYHFDIGHREKPNEIVVCFERMISRRAVGEKGVSMLISEPYILVFGTDNIHAYICTSCICRT